MAGEAVVGGAVYELRADQKPLQRDLQQAEGSIKKSGAAAESAFGKQATAAIGKTDRASVGLLGRMKQMAGGGGIGGALLGGLGVGAGLGVFSLVTSGLAGVVDWLGSTGEAASDMAETQGKLGQVFKTSGQDVLDWSENAARGMGMSKQSALEAAGTLGNFLQAMGTTEQQAASMSTTMVGLSSDLASFNNAAGGSEEVLLAIRSGLAGETEPLRRFGVDVSDAAVQAELLATGAEKVNGAFTMAQKIQARYAIIMRQTTTAQGDYARTANGTANRQRTLAALQADLNAKVGVFVNNVTNAATGLAIDLVGGIEDVLTGLDNLRRFLDPASAAIEDTDKAVLAMADKFGLSGPAILEMAKQMREADKATEDLRLSMKLMDATESGMAATQQLLADTAKMYNTDLTDLTSGFAEYLATHGQVLTDITDEGQRWAAITGPLQAYLEQAGLYDPVAGKITSAQMAQEDAAMALINAYAKLTPEERAVYEAAAAMAAPVEDTADAMDTGTDSAAQLAAQLRAVQDALALVAERGFKELTQGIKEAEKAWEDLLDGPDQNQKSLRKLNHEIDVWERRYLGALRRGRTDEAAFALQQLTSLTSERDARRAAREEVAKQQVEIKSLAQETNVSMRVAARAYREANGDIAKATEAINAQAGEVGDLRDKLRDLPVGVIPVDVDVDVRGDQDVQALLNKLRQLPVGVVPVDVMADVAGSGGGGKKPRRHKPTAGGGWRTRGTATLVGEYGPELRIEPTSGLYLDAYRTAQALAGPRRGGGNIYNLAVHISAGAYLGRPNEARAWAREVAPVIGQELARLMPATEY